MLFFLTIFAFAASSSSSSSSSSSGSSSSSCSSSSCTASPACAQLSAQEEELKAKHCFGEHGWACWEMISVVEKLADEAKTLRHAAELTQLTGEDLHEGIQAFWAIDQSNADVELQSSFNDHGGYEALTVPQIAKDFDNYAYLMNTRLQRERVLACGASLSYGYWKEKGENEPVRVQLDYCKQARLNSYIRICGALNLYAFDPIKT